MMRMVAAAYAIGAALLFAFGTFGSTPADAGYYRSGYDRAAVYYGPRGGAVVVRSGYYGGRGSYGGYRAGYYSRPYGYGVRYSNADYYRDSGTYGDGGYYGDSSTYGGDDYYGDGYTTNYGYGGYGYGGYGYGGCHTAYIPYGWTWYRASSC